MRISRAARGAAVGVALGALIAGLWVGCGKRDAQSAAASGSATVSTPAVVHPAPTGTAAAAASTSTSATTSTSTSGAVVLDLPDGGPFRVIDLHVDTPWRVNFKGVPASLPSGPATAGLLREGNYAGIVYPIYIPDYLHKDKPTVADAEEIYGTIDKIVEAQELLVPATGSVPADKVAVFVSIEGAGAFAADVEKIDGFIQRGVRFVGPAHAQDNRLSGAATGRKGGGLTELGKRFCQRVYAAGGLVDVSHMSDKAFADLVPIAKAAGAPIVATHSNARKISHHRRNLTDDQLKTIAATDGVAGLNLHRGFIGGHMKDVVKMVKHMVDVAGIDHVAIGTDFEGATPIKAVSDASKMPELAAALVKAGLSDADVRKIFARNALRVLNWRPAGK
jgi:membrane dipeptidase